VGDGSRRSATPRAAEAGRPFQRGPAWRMMRRAMRGRTRGSARSGRPLRVAARRAARQALAAALLGLGLLLAAAFVAIAVQGNAVAREAAALRAEIAALQLKQAALQAMVAERATDDYVVDRARDLGYVRRGEALIAVQPDGVRSAVRSPEVGAPGRLARWLALFFR